VTPDKSTRSSAEPKKTMRQFTSSLASTLKRKQPHDEHPTNLDDEVARYLNDPLTGSDSQSLFQEWANLAPRYPQLTQMAKDILAIPAAGVGVERLFNIARDTVSYRRGHLAADTIEEIMIIKYYLSSANESELDEFLHSLQQDIHISKHKINQPEDPDESSSEIDTIFKLTQTLSDVEQDQDIDLPELIEQYPHDGIRIDTDDYDEKLYQTDSSNDPLSFDGPSETVPPVRQSTRPKRSPHKPYRSFT
jgi:hypothetical protein